MAKKPANAHKPWTRDDKQTLRHEAGIGRVTPMIAHILGRSVNAVYDEASKLHVTLHPTNKSPDKRRKH